MGQEEVVVAPALEARVEAGVVARAAVAQRAVKVGRVRRARRNTASGRCRRRTSPVRRAGCGARWRARSGCAGCAGGRSARSPVARKLLAVARQRARHLRAAASVHVGERDPGLLEQRPVGEHARAPAAARRAASRRPRGSAAPPSAASIAAVMRSCSSMKNSAARSSSVIAMVRPASRYAVSSAAIRSPDVAEARVALAQVLEEVQRLARRRPAARTPRPAGNTAPAIRTT